ncbi:ABC transporter permease [Rahnella woolbedingensis]|uniref:ABC transporter permease n=1 Tax=Rahnella woolbedingensis TaxID=1510574 RepID=A0A419N5P4_9GAMM|nr:ABC transporter permease [Rahnella woolbedingensis]RJT41539.1 ABC transporter permease [Rahnella woolbedingensis]
MFAKSRNVSLKAKPDARPRLKIGNLKIDNTTLGLSLLLLVVIIGFSVAMPGRFFSDATFTSVAFQLPELGLLTLAMFIPILSGGLNLCIIATANLTSLLMAWVFLTWLPPDASMAMQAVWLTLALVGAMILALVIGMLTGALVAYVGAHPILVTLATMTMVNGVGIYLSRGAAISGMPDIVRFIGAETLLGVPVPLIIFLLTAALIAVFLERTPLGKYIYMSGSNINATHFSGINTHRVLIAIYVISSMLCVIAGLIMMARFNSARMGYGDSYLLLTVLAIILGGTDPNGGFGKVAGVVLSLIVLQVISTGLNLMNVSPHFSLAMWGAVLIVVLALKFFRSRYLQKRAGRMSAAKARAAQP